MNKLITAGDTEGFAEAMGTCETAHGHVALRFGVSRAGLEMQEFVAAEMARPGFCAADLILGLHISNLGVIASIAAHRVKPAGIPHVAKLLTTKVERTFPLMVEERRAFIAKLQTGAAP